MRAASYFSVLANINVSGMSYPVRYSEIATLAQRILEGLSLPPSKAMVLKTLPTLCVSIADE